MGKKLKVEFNTGVRITVLVLVVVLFVLIIVFVGKSNDRTVVEKKVENKDQQLKIGFITDSHCYGKLNKNGTWETNWRCTYPINSFVKQMKNDFEPDVVIQGGDLCDGRDDECMKNLEFGKQLLQGIEGVPMFHVLGNHEAREIEKQQWLELFDYQRTYYAFDIKNYRIIILDANYFPEKYRGDKERVLDPDLNITPESDDYYPGYIPEKQTEWLESMLEQAQDRTKLVFIHHPPLERTTVRPRSRLLSNAAQLREMFSRYGVSAVFSGHIEEFCQIEDGGVRYYVLQGGHKGNDMLAKEEQYENAGVFSEVTIEKNKIEVRVFFSKNRGESYEDFVLSQETAVCNNESTK